MMNSSFDAHRALSLAAMLARPRRVGSGADEAVIQQINDMLLKLGYRVRRQQFGFSAGADLAATLLVFAGLMLVLLTFWAWEAAPMSASLLAALLLALLALPGRLLQVVSWASLTPPSGATSDGWKRIWRRLSRRYTSANLVATNGDPRARPQLILMAHTDSKSQALPLTWRIALIVVSGCGAALFALLSIVRPLLPGVSDAAAVAAIASLLAGIPLLVLFAIGPGNSSPGAIDNASGMGLLLHLAEVLSWDPPRVPVMLLFTGAEEMGLMGAAAFVRDAVATGGLAEPRPLVLNLDGIGAAGRLVHIGGSANSDLAALLRAACHAAGQPLGRLPLIGAAFDHVPFAHAGCDSVSLASLGAASRSVHTPRDTPNRLDARGFRQAGLAVLGIVALLERRTAHRDSGAFIAPP
jgi:hypothetical protein